MIEHEQATLAKMLKESIRQGITPSLTVISNSMSPLLRSGDQIGLERVLRAEVQTGQIITFWNPGEGSQLITHRVASAARQLSEGKIITYGDRSLLIDAPVASNGLIGSVIWRKRNDQVFDLRSSRGRWLNKRLAKLASNNLKLVSGLDIGIDKLDSSSLSRSNEVCRKQRARLYLRIYLRIRYLWASLLVRYAEFAAGDRRE